MITHETSEPEYCTVAEAAEMLRVSKPTVWRWIASGRLRAMRIGPRAIRVERSELWRLGRPAHSRRGLTASEIESYIQPRRAPRRSRDESDALIDEINERILAQNGGKPLDSSLPRIHEQRR